MAMPPVHAVFKILLYAQLSWQGTQVAAAIAFQ